MHVKHFMLLAKCYLPGLFKDEREPICSKYVQLL